MKTSGYQTHHYDYQTRRVDKTPLEKLKTTARVDNPGSWRILEKVGMERDPEPKPMFGNGMRYIYRKAL